MTTATSTTTKLINTFLDDILHKSPLDGLRSSMRTTTEEAFLWPATSSHAYPASAPALPPAPVNGILCRAKAVNTDNGYVHAEEEAVATLDEDVLVVTNGCGVEETDDLCAPGRRGKKKKKRVSFPAGDSCLVTNKHDYVGPSTLRTLNECDDQDSLLSHQVLHAYMNACYKYRVNPSTVVQKQIGQFRPGTARQEKFSLRGEKVTAGYMECLEEVFKRVQFIVVDFEYCYLDDEASVALCDMLEYYDSALRLNLSFNQHIGRRGWEAVCRLLKKSPCLEDINLRYTSISDRTIPLLARTLRTESSLTSVHLENCNLSGKPLLILVQAMKVNTSISELYLAENNLSTTDSVHIYQLIVNNRSVQLLDLRNNHLTDAGLANICDALCHNTHKDRLTLNTLVLWNNRLTAHGMSHIARVMRENITLQTLNLGSNSIGSEGASAIKDALTRNRTLLRLGLQATKLNCQGAIAIAESVADNTSLVRIDLRDNSDIRLAGLLALHLAMKVNMSVTTLNLDKSCMSANHTKVREYSDQFKQIYGEIQEFSARNRRSVEQRLQQSGEQAGAKREAADYRQETPESAEETGELHLVCTSAEALIKSAEEQQAEPSSPVTADDEQIECVVREIVQALLDEASASTARAKLAEIALNTTVTPVGKKSTTGVIRKFSLTCSGDSIDRYRDRVDALTAQLKKSARLEEENEEEEEDQRARYAERARSRPYTLIMPPPKNGSPSSDRFAHVKSPADIRLPPSAPLRDCVTPSDPSNPSLPSAPCKYEPVRSTGRFSVTFVPSVAPAAKRRLGSRFSVTPVELMPDSLLDHSQTPQLSRADSNPEISSLAVNIPSLDPPTPAGSLRGMYSSRPPPGDASPGSYTISGCSFVPKDMPQSLRSVFVPENAETDGEILHAVSACVRDLVHFADYQVLNSPTRKRNTILTQLGRKREEQLTKDVNSVVQDLVNYAVYETGFPSS